MFKTPLSYKIPSLTTGTTQEAQFILPHQDTAHHPITWVKTASSTSVILLPSKTQISNGPSFQLNTFLWWFILSQTTDNLLCCRAWGWVNVYTCREISVLSLNFTSKYQFKSPILKLLIDQNVRYFWACEIKMHASYLLVKKSKHFTGECCWSSLPCIFFWCECNFSI